MPSYELFSGTAVLGRMAMERMLAGLSTRRYPVGLEPIGQRTEQAATSTSRSAVSRRFVAATECHEAGGLPPGARLLVLGRQNVSEGGRLSWCTSGWT